MKHLAVSSYLNFFPWLEGLPFLPASPRGWIVEGQRLSHREYQRLVDEIAREMEERDGGDFVTLTEAYLAARQDADCRHKEHFR